MKKCVAAKVRSILREESLSALLCHTLFETKTLPGTGEGTEMKQRRHKFFRSEQVAHPSPICPQRQQIVVGICGHSAERIQVSCKEAKRLVMLNADDLRRKGIGGIEPPNLRRIYVEAWLSTNSRFCKYTVCKKIKSCKTCASCKTFFVQNDSLCECCSPQSKAAQRLFRAN